MTYWDLKFNKPLDTSFRVRLIISVSSHSSSIYHNCLWCVYNNKCLWVTHCLVATLDLWPSGGEAKRQVITELNWIQARLLVDLVINSFSKPYICWTKLMLLHFGISCSQSQCLGVEPQALQDLFITIFLLCILFHHLKKNNIYIKWKKHIQWSFRNVLNEMILSDIPRLKYHVMGLLYQIYSKVAPVQWICLI